MKRAFATQWKPLYSVTGAVSSFLLKQQRRATAEPTEPQLKLFALAAASAAEERELKATALSR